MIRIHALGSSSAGNSFVLDDGITKILLDAGLHTHDIKTKLFELDIRQKDISGILVTHDHQDHLQGVSAVASCNKYMTKGTLEGARNNFLKGMTNIEIIEVGKAFKINTFTIKAFKTKHDTREPVGYLIKNASGEKIVYMTDTGIANMLVPNADAYIIESNHYSKEALFASAANPEKTRMSMELAERISKTHLSQEQTLEYLQKCIGDKTKAIILMHISPTHPNPVGMMNWFRKKLDTDIVQFVHPKKHKPKNYWEVGFKPTNKRSF